MLPSNAMKFTNWEHWISCQYHANICGVILINCPMSLHVGQVCATVLYPCLFQFSVSVLTCLDPLARCLCEHTLTRVRCIHFVVVQVGILQDGLELHEQLITKDLEPFHEKMERCFAEMKYRVTGERVPEKPWESNKELVVRTSFLVLSSLMFSVLYWTVLCCAVLCCAVLCCAVLCCAVLCCAVLCCAVLCCAVLCCAVLCCTVLCSCALLYCTVLCRTVLYNLLYCPILSLFSCLLSSLFPLFLFFPFESCLSTVPGTPASASRRVTIEIQEWSQTESAPRHAEKVRSTVSRVEPKEHETSSILTLSVRTTTHLERYSWNCSSASHDVPAGSSRVIVKHPGTFHRLTDETLTKQGRGEGIHASHRAAQARETLEKLTETCWRVSELKHCSLRSSVVWVGGEILVVPEILLLSKQRNDGRSLVLSDGPRLGQACSSTGFDFLSPQSPTGQPAHCTRARVAARANSPMRPVCGTTDCLHRLRRQCRCRYRRHRRHRRSCPRPVGSPATARCVRPRSQLSRRAIRPILSGSVYCYYHRAWRLSEGRGEGGLRR